jgi:hypothetical protein
VLLPEKVKLLRDWNGKKFQNYDTMTCLKVKLALPIEPQKQTHPLHSMRLIPYAHSLLQQRQLTSILIGDAALCVFS